VEAEAGEDAAPPALDRPTDDVADVLFIGRPSIRCDGTSSSSHGKPTLGGVAIFASKKAR
jgi:hypothetical protein